MGHHLFIVGTSSLGMRDGDLELVRHFLIEGARRIELNVVSLEIERWAWHGPGVWVGIEEQALSSHPEIFSSAVQVASALGTEVSLAYIHSHLPPREGVSWSAPISTNGIVSELRRLAEFFGARA